MSAVRLEWIVFYVGIPLIQAVLNGSKGTTYAPDVGPGVLIPFWYVCGQTFWGLCGVFSLASARLFERIPLLLCALAGGLVSIVLSYFYIGLVIGMSGEVVGALASLVAPGTFILKDGLFSYVFGANAFGGVATWVAASALRSRIRHGVWDARLQRVREDAGSSVETRSNQSTPLQPPAFMNKLNPTLQGDIIAIEAQEHYIKVYTPNGSGLVLYRFRDALADLADWPGFRVHRSFWVSKSAVEKVDGRGRGYTLTLENELKVPVSQSYRGVIESAGLI